MSTTTTAANGGTSFFNAPGIFDLGQTTTPASPSSGSNKLYFKSDDILYRLNSAGVETAVGAGSGDVSGPGAAVTDNAITRWNGVSGMSVQNSVVLVGDLGEVSGITTLGASGAVTFSNLGTTGIVHNSAAGLLSTSLIVNADVHATAAIAVNKLAALTASRAVASDGSGFLTVSTTTASELDFVSGVTSAIQTQLNAKAATASPTFTGQVAFPVGSVSAPGLAPAGDLDSGVYSGGANVIAISGGGALCGAFYSAAIQINAGSASVPGLGVIGDEDTGVYRSAANTLDFATAGVQALSITSAGRLRAVSGSQALPTYGFIGDNDTGWYRSSEDVINVVTGGSIRVSFDNNSNMRFISGGTGNAVIGALSTGFMDSAAFTGATDARFRAYGPTHATLPSQLHLINSTGVVLSVTQAGVVTLGVTASTATHVVNGNQVSLLAVGNGNPAKYYAKCTGTNSTDHASLHVEAEGTGGNALVQFDFTNLAVDWTMGAVRGDSGNFHLSNSTSLGTSTYLKATTAGLVTIGATSGTQTNVVNGNLATTFPTAGSNSFVSTTHSDNTNGASNAYHDMAVGGVSGGDPHTRYTIPSGTSWYAGVDNSDSDAYKIGIGSAVGTTTQIALLSSAAYFAATGIRWNLGGTAATVVNHTLGASDGVHVFSGDTGIGSGSSRIECYGSTHASAPNDVRMYGANASAMFEHDGDADTTTLRTAGTNRFIISAAGVITIGNGTSNTHVLNTATEAASTGVLTLTNGPGASTGNPAVYFRLNVNGTNYVVPAWAF